MKAEKRNKTKRRNKEVVISYQVEGPFDDTAIAPPAPVFQFEFRKHRSTFDPRLLQKSDRKHNMRYITRGLPMYISSIGFTCDANFVDEKSSSGNKMSL